MLREKERGAAIVYISTELEEVMTISDRIAVMYWGEFVGVLDAKTVRVEEVGLLMGGERGHREMGRWENFLTQRDTKVNAKVRGVLNSSLNFQIKQKTFLKPLRHFALTSALLCVY